MQESGFRGMGVSLLNPQCGKGGCSDGLGAFLAVQGVGHWLEICPRSLDNTLGSEETSASPPTHEPPPFECALFAFRPLDISIIFPPTCCLGRELMLAP